MPHIELTNSVTMSTIITSNDNGAALVCEFCKEGQFSLESLEIHTLSVHGSIGTEYPKGNLEFTWITNTIAENIPKFFIDWFLFTENSPLEADPINSIV